MESLNVIDQEEASVIPGCFIFLFLFFSPSVSLWCLCLLVKGLIPPDQAWGYLSKSSPTSFSFKASHPSGKRMSRHMTVEFFGPSLYVKVNIWCESFFLFSFLCFPSLICLWLPDSSCSFAQGCWIDLVTNAGLVLPRGFPFSSGRSKSPRAHCLGT